MNLDISEEKILESIKRWEEKIEKLRWKNDLYHNEFIDFLLRTVVDCIDSDSYIYNDEEIKENYTGEEFSSLLYSLFNIVDEYANNHDVDGIFNKDDNSYYSEEFYYLKIKENYYSIELIVGQGSFIRFSKVFDWNMENIRWINYDNILEFLNIF